MDLGQEQALLLVLRLSSCPGRHAGITTTPAAQSLGRGSRAFALRGDRGKQRSVIRGPQKTRASLCSPPRALQKKTPENLSSLQQYHPSGQERVSLTHLFHRDECMEVNTLNKQAEICEATLSKNGIFTSFRYLESLPSLAELFPHRQSLQM